MDQHFQRIAESAGPHKGVIIAPSPKHDESYLESLLQVKARSRGEFFRSVYPSIAGKPVDKSFLEEEGKLHWGYPVIIFSRTPLHEEMDKNEAVVIKLASCRDEKDLSKVIDVLLSVIRNDDMSKLEKLHQLLRPSTTKDRTKSAELIDALELKPNFLGLVSISIIC